MNEPATNKQRCKFVFCRAMRCDVVLSYCYLMLRSNQPFERSFEHTRMRCSVENNWGCPPMAYLSKASFSNCVVNGGTLGRPKGAMLQPLCHQQHRAPWPWAAGCASISAAEAAVVSRRGIAVCWKWKARRCRWWNGPTAGVCRHRDLHKISI